MKDSLIDSKIMKNKNWQNMDLRKLGIRKSLVGH